MRLTPVLYVRQFLAKLHPPLPKTPRESRQLLNLLEISFRKHLDEIHPAPKAQEDAANAPQHLIPLSPSSSVAHHYLNSVLMHPLLEKQIGGNTKGQTLTGDAVGRFDEALVNGSITISLLASCVKQYARGISNGEQVLENQTLAQRVASWLYSSSSSTKKAFFTAPDLIGRVVPIMAADRQETTVWEWLRIVYERDLGQDSQQHFDVADSRWLKVEDSLVSELMRLSVRRKDLNDAAQQFVEACRYRRDSGRAVVSQSEASGELPYVPMSSSWKRLAAAVIQFRNSHGIEAKLFDAAMQSSLRWSDAPHFSEAVLAVYHPTAPSSQVLCQKLYNSESACEFLASHETSSRIMRKAMLVVVLDGAQLSLDQRLRQDAKFLLEFAGAHYPEFLPFIQSQDKQTIEVQLKAIHDALRAPDLGSLKLGLA